MTRGELLQPDPHSGPSTPSAPSLTAAGEATGAVLSPTAAALVAAVQGCNVAVAHCVRRGGRHADADLLGRLVDGIELGQTAAELEERRSPLLSAQLEVCAAAFGRAAQACALLPDDPVLAWCGQACSSAAASLST
jgi:hypothetical protein